MLKQFLVLPLLVVTSSAAAGQIVPSIHWKPNDVDRSQPPVVLPGGCSGDTQAGDAPADAIVLFDGKNLSQWLGVKETPPRWKLGDGYMEVVSRTGSIHTRQAFGDCQLHLECATPDPPTGTGQGRGNSGIILMSHYEIQILDSYHNTTYADGAAAAVYSQYPPLVNVSRPPGRWQTYDIVFHAPRFGPDQSLMKAATVTVFFNGVLVQDNVTLTGPTGTRHAERRPYQAHPDRLPLLLQDHGCPVRFRNIWIRELQNMNTGSED
ncbi:MAG: DUF1080 domain-containing protein [Bryobacteraceae bacterium]|jgi:hypothetical protein